MTGSLAYTINLILDITVMLGVGGAMFAVYWQLREPDERVAAKLKSGDDKNPVPPTRRPPAPASARTPRRVHARRQYEVSVCRARGEGDHLRLASAAVDARRLGPVVTGMSRQTRASSAVRLSRRSRTSRNEARHPGGFRYGRANSPMRGEAA